MNTQVSIIIVNYNTKELLSDCLNSIYKQTKGIDFEVIVSDNGSEDGSIEILKTEFPQVYLIENNENIGFSAANNRGLLVAQGKYILYLNSDTVLLNNAVKLFYDFFEKYGEKEKIGALGCELLNEKMQNTHSGENLISKKKIFHDATVDFFMVLRRSFFFFLPESFSFSKLLKRNQPINQPINYSINQSYFEIGYIIGADLFLKNDDFAKFDERYILYFEDADLQIKLNENNLKRLIITTPKIQHLEHKSNRYSKKIDYFKTFSKINYMLSAIIYTKKNLHSPILYFYLKILALLIFFNPFLFKNTKKYILKLLRL